MRKIFIFMLLLKTILLADISNFVVMQFDHYYPDENFFVFKPNPTKKLICRPYGIKMITLMDNPKCLIGEDALDGFYTKYKRSIQKILKPRANFYVKLKKKIKNYYLCDIATNKKNYRLELVKAGFAVPTEDNKKLFEANLNAKNQKIGMYSEKFEKITQCILMGLNSTTDEENSDSSNSNTNPNVESIPIDKSLPKIQIQIL